MPEDLVEVGTYVELHDGTIGVVAHYECFSPSQSSFPVRLGPLTLMLTRRHLRQVPAIVVPQPRQEAARTKRKAPAKV